MGTRNKKQEGEEDYCCVASRLEVLYVCLLTNRMHRRRAVRPRPRETKKKAGFI